MKKLSLIGILVVFILSVVTPVVLAAKDDIPWMVSPSSIGVPIEVEPEIPSGDDPIVIP